ncbi:MAG: hypothetical protein JW963_25135 [Anaerolineales bacterium]|nr:hypothetical protein [Anaerolineales bacterium]
MAPDNQIFRRRLIFNSIQICIIVLVLLVTPTPVLASSNPAEGDNTKNALPDYRNFVESVQNGQTGVLRGVYVDGVLALPIVQQPVGHPGFVSQNADEITQFNMAAEVGNVGLLAHNYLSGASFTNLAPGQEVRLIYGDGAIEYFIVDQIYQYQALQPYSPNSEFRDLETDITITAEALFRKVYRGERHVTFQTCIEADGNSSWGRLFITAQPKLFPFVEQQYIHESLLPYLYEEVSY